MFEEEGEKVQHLGEFKPACVLLGECSTAALRQQLRYDNSCGTTTAAHHTKYTELLAMASA